MLHGYGSKLFHLLLLGCGIYLAGCVSNEPATQSADPATLLSSAVKQTPILQAKPNLSGAWILNRELSDDPYEKIKAAIKQAHGRRMEEAIGHGGMGRGGQGHNGKAVRGGRSSDGDGNSMIRKMNIPQLATDRLELVHKEPVLLIITQGSHQRRIYTDNRGSSISASGSAQQRVTTAGWEQGILVIEITSDSGPKMVRHYKLDTQSRQLSITTIIQIPYSSEPLSFNQIYNPAKQLK